MPSDEEGRIAEILRQLDECGKCVEREIVDLSNRVIPDSELDIVGSYAVPTEFKNLMKLTQSVLILPQPPVFHVSTTDSKLAGLLKSSSVHNSLYNSPVSPNRRKISVPNEIKGNASILHAISPTSPLVNIVMPPKLPSISDINSVKLPNTAPRVPVIPPNISTSSSTVITSGSGSDDGPNKRLKNDYKGPISKIMTADTSESNDDTKGAIEETDLTASPKSRRGRAAKDAIELTPTKLDKSASKVNKKTPEPSPKKKKDVEEEVTIAKRKSLRSATNEPEDLQEESAPNKKKGLRSIVADNDDEPPAKKRGLRSGGEAEDIKSNKDKEKEKRSSPPSSISTRPRRNVK